MGIIGFFRFFYLNKQLGSLLVDLAHQLIHYFLVVRSCKQKEILTICGMTNWNWVKFGAGFLLFFSYVFYPKTPLAFWVLPGCLNPGSWALADISNCLYLINRRDLVKFLNNLMASFIRQSTDRRTDAGSGDQRRRTHHKTELWNTSSASHLSKLLSTNEPRTQQQFQ